MSTHMGSGGLHHPLILQEMFLQVAHLGRKEVEWMVCQGCQHGLPCLDLQVDISAVWVVGPQTTREEIGNLYYEVYKLKRLPGSAPCGLKWVEELTADIVSSLKDHLRWREGQPPRDSEEPGPADTQPSRSNTPQRRRRGTSTVRDLTKAREAHWRILATMAALEEKIERLSWSVTRGWLDARAHSQSCDHWRRRSQGWNRRHCRVRLEESPALSSEPNPPQWGPGHGEDEEARLPFLDFDLSCHQS